MRTFRQLAMLAALTALLAGCFGINRDIEVPAGSRLEQSQTTVNGSVSLGQDAIVEGDLQTVNGSIRVGSGATADRVQTVNGSVSLAAGARVKSIETVNGGVSLAANAQVERSVEAVNGQIKAGNGAVVDGKIETVNGEIVLDGARAGSLTNTNGGMRLAAGATVLGELRIERPRRGNLKPVTVTIGADCRVVGPLVFERETILRVHRSAEIGEVIGAQPEWFDDEA